MRYFAARFDPAADRSHMAAARDAFVASLDAVTNIGEDRMLRALSELVGATVRTNYYAAGARAGDRIAFKVACDEIEQMPRPRPLYEIYVHGADMEGAHLRAGKIARGGIRYSDRHDPDGQERGDRAGGRQGRFHRQARRRPA
jgi:glutamate dehydrogenase